MSQQLESVVVSRLDEHNWEAHHIPSGRKLQGPSAAEATERMRVDLGMNDAGAFTEPARPSTGRLGRLPNISKGQFPKCWLCTPDTPD